MITHTLKIDPAMFKEVVSGNKKFEFRKEDREQDFTQGDSLILKCFDRETQTYNGLEYRTIIGFCLRGPEYGVPPGTVIFSIGG